MVESKLIESLSAAKRSGVPLIKISTADPTPVIEAIAEAFPNVPVLVWNVVSGVLPADNPASIAAAAPLNMVNNENVSPSIATGNPVDALIKASGLPQGSILIMNNLGIFLEEGGSESWKPTAQAVWNLRDEFKSTLRMLVIVGGDFKLPSPLKSDVIELVDPAPSRPELRKIVEQTCQAGKVEFTQEDADSCVECIAGVLSAFLAENIVATSIRPKDGKKQIDYDFMWSQSIAAIERTSGLKVIRDKASLSEIGGLTNIKEYLSRIARGKRRPSLVVLLDELEKQLGGLSGDTTGVSQDAYGQLLTAMNDYDWSGILFPGFPGTGKSQCAKALGSESGGLFIMMDMGGMRDSLVGKSEQMIRNAIAVLRARGGDRVFFVGTVNDVSAIPAPLFRRMTHGTFFFDLPTAEEQKPIWEIWLKRYNISSQPLPECDGWTGAEIRNCCARADELGISLIEASSYVSPVVKTMGDDVQKLRASAAGKYLSASAPGLYTPHTKKAAVSAPRALGKN